MLRKSFAVLLCLMLLCFGCSSSKTTAEWTAASLRNEDGFFVVPGAEPRTSLEELEKVLGYSLEPMEEIQAYSLAEKRRYVPSDIDRASMEVAFYGSRAVPGFIFSLTETNGDPEALDSVSLVFSDMDAENVSEKFLAEARALWGEPTEIIQGEGAIAVNGKKEPTENIQQHWRVDGDGYITVLGAATITQNGKIIRFMLEWGTYDAADTQ